MTARRSDEGAGALLRITGRLRQQARPERGQVRVNVLDRRGGERDRSATTISG